MDFKTPAELGKYLRSHRKELRLTQAEAAALANVGLRFIIELEKGKKSASLGKVIQVIHSYGLTLSLRSKNRKPGE